MILLPNIPQPTSVRWLPESELENLQGENLRLDSGVSAAFVPTNTVRDCNLNSILIQYLQISGSFYPVPVRPDRCEENSLYPVPVCCCGLRNHSNVSRPYRTDGSNFQGHLFTRSCRTTDLQAVSVGSWPIGAGTERMIMHNKH